MHSAVVVATISLNCLAKSTEAQVTVVVVQCNRRSLQICQYRIYIWYPRRRFKRIKEEEWAHDTNNEAAKENSTLHPYIICTHFAAVAKRQQQHQQIAVCDGEKNSSTLNRLRSPFELNIFHVNIEFFGLSTISNSIVWQWYACAMIADVCVYLYRCEWSNAFFTVSNVKCKEKEENAYTRR